MIGQFEMTIFPVWIESEEIDFELQEVLFPIH